MEDITESVLLGGYAFPEEEPILDEPDTAAPAITASMLNSRPDIRDVLVQELDEYLVKWADLNSVLPDDEGDEDGDEPEIGRTFTDEQLLNAINSDPYVQGTVFECLNRIADLTDQEGASQYFPSIFDTDDASVLRDYLATGIREDQIIEDLPAKYAHLDSETINLIYSHPQCRQVLAKMPGIPTKELVHALI